MSRTCYLHIGIPKTGTSFIQSFLSANRERLRSEGQLLYPSSLLTSGIASHRRFSASIQAPRNTAADRQLFRINADNSDAFTKEVWLELDRELEHSSPSKVVISSEFCVNFDGSEIARLAEYLHARFEDVRVVVYLRRQDEHAVSGFDDRSFASHTNPSLTTVRMPLQEIGHTAASMLFAMIEDAQLPRRHIVLPTEVVWRDSTPAR